jgi:poly(beta-D-mannuronate) lyase
VPKNALSITALFLLGACTPAKTMTRGPGDQGGEGGGDGGTGGTPSTATGGKPGTGGKGDTGGAVGTGGAAPGGSGGGGGTALDAGPGEPDSGARDSGPPPDLGPTPDAPPALGEPPVCARKVPVSGLAPLATAIGAAMPGDCIVLANGSYDSTGVISVNRAGTAAARITITAETIGGVTISGAGGFHLDSPAAYVVIRGFKFTHSGALVMGLDTNHCTITRNVFELAGSGDYLYVQGLDQEVSYNLFQNKTSAGAMVQIDASGRSHAGTQRPYLHHNHWYKHNFTGGNGGECIATWGGFTRAEYNLFQECNGDPEIITAKSSDGIYRYNTFRDSTRGMFSFRYGNRITAEGNFFFGLAGGIRAYGTDHKIINNYFEGNKGVGIYVSNGAADGTYIQIQRMLIANNTLVGDAIAPRAGDLPPLTVTIVNNIVRKDGGTFASEGPGWMGTKWEGNIFWGSATTTIPASGYKKVDPLLTASGGVSHLGAGSPAIDGAVGSYGVTEDMDGQPRMGVADVGADELSTAAVKRRPLTATDVGPMAGL